MVLHSLEGSHDHQMWEVLAVKGVAADGVGHDELGVLVPKWRETNKLLVMNWLVFFLLPL